MRLVLVLLLAAPCIAEEPSRSRPSQSRGVVLSEPRGWTGELVIERSTKGEVHREVAKFILLTDPARTSGSRARLKLRQYSVSCDWSLRFDRRESQGAGDLITKGGGSGTMLVAVRGLIDTTTGKVYLKVSTSRRRLLAKTMLSGIDSKGFAAHQTVASRSPLLTSRTVNGKLSADGRAVVGDNPSAVVRGERPHTLTIRWSLRRMDPDVRGRVSDQHGAPVANVEVLARTMGREGMLIHKGKSDAEGHFSIPAGFGPWGVQVLGRHENGMVSGGWSRVNAVDLKLVKESSLDVRVERYRLKKLPESRLLNSYFDGNVDAYLSYLSERVSAARLRAARATSSTPSPAEAAAPRR